MDPMAIIVDIKPSGREISTIHKTEVGYYNTTFSCNLIISRFHNSNIFRIVCMAEFYYPMPFCIRKDCLRPCSSAVAAIIQQQPCIFILLLFQDLKCHLLKPIKICYGFLMFKVD